MIMYGYKTEQYTRMCTSMHTHARTHTFHGSKDSQADYRMWNKSSSTKHTDEKNLKY